VRTFPQMLRSLAQIACNYIVATEWKPETSQQIRKLIQQKRRHFHNSKASLVNYLNTQGPAAHDVLLDDGAAAMVTSLGMCLEEIELHGRAFGEFSLTLVLYSPDLATLRHSVAQSSKTVASYDAQLIDERYNLLNAWLAIQPGNAAFNLRRFWLHSANYTDLSLLFTPSCGDVYNEQLESEYVAILEGRGGTPYFFNFHYHDVAHTLVLGATGSGKSFFLNFCLTHAQKYAPYTYIFDLGGSYETVTRLFHGSYFRVGAVKRAFTINPFSLPLTPDNLLFLFAFVRVLIESKGYALTAEDERDLYEQIESLYSVAPDQRRLLTLSTIVRRNLCGPLQKWVQGGPYAELFDNSEDTLTLSHFQTFDFEGMEKAPDQLEPLLFYILHRANAMLSESGRVLKLFVMDEAWRFFRHPVIRAYIVEGLKTWRRKNAAMLLATQSGEDLLASELLPIVVESCPTKLFLANPGIDPAAYARAFQLNEAEVDTIARLNPKQQMLLKRPNGSRVLALNVDRRGYWLYTNNPKDNALRREAFERHGFERGLEFLAKENT
jgi:type IV secretion/conjugal transfer VirB4 family ATPase